MFIFIRFETFDELVEFTRRRAIQGVQQWMPIRFNIEDGVLLVLPGKFGLKIAKKKIMFGISSITLRNFAGHC